ncbi:MAG: hypothetical protein PVH29_08680 [Candidatus Zixiibacteriota bacterium]|jgi:hypothetical protein
MDFVLLRNRYVFVVNTALAVFAGAAAVPAVSRADNELLERGTITVSLDTGTWYLSGGTALYVGPGIGIFVARGLWLGGSVDLGTYGFEDAYGAIGFGPDYHFDTGPKWSPYVGLWVRATSFFDGDVGLVPRFGAKFFVVPRTALVAGYEGRVYFPAYRDGPVFGHMLGTGFQVFF